MLCFRYKRLLVPYFEGGLNAVIRERVERHLAGCARCRAELGAVSAVSGALRSAGSSAMEPASDLWAKVSASIAERRPARVSRPWVRFASAASACAAIALVAVVGMNTMRRSQPALPGPPPQKIAAFKHVTVLPGQQVARANAPVLKVKPPSAPVEPKTAPVPALTRPPAELARKLPNMIASARVESKAEISKMPALMATPSVDEGKAVRITGSANVYSTAAAATAAMPASPAATSAGTLNYADSEDLDTTVRAKSVRPGGTLIGSFSRRARPVGPAGGSGESVVDTLNKTEGTRVAALFTYP